MKKIFLSLLSLGLLSSCAVENINTVTPVMVTYEPQNVLTTSASMGGYTLSEGGKAITEYGIVVSTNDNPTIHDTKVVAGERVGDYYLTYEGFDPQTTYYYRAYGINEIGPGYGETYSFTTQEEAACNPAQNNFIDTHFYPLDIHDVSMEYIPYPHDDGNMEFQTYTSNSTAVIKLAFKEIDHRLPLTGTYTIVHSFYDQQEYSQGTVMLSFNDYLFWEHGSSSGTEGDKIYVENNNGIVTFIFCDLELNQYYTLNGKFTYTE